MWTQWIFWHRSAYAIEKKFLYRNMKLHRYITINYKKPSLWSILLNISNVGEAWITRIIKTLVIPTRQRVVRKNIYSQDKVPYIILLKEFGLPTLTARRVTLCTYFRNNLRCNPLLQCILPDPYCPPKPRLPQSKEQESQILILLMQELSATERFLCHRYLKS